MVHKSLAFRIVAYSGAWIVMVLLIAALLLVYFYRDHIAQQSDRHVSLHFEELVEASRFLPGGTFALAFQPSDPRYHDLNSGWYWQVKQSGVTLARSPSLGENSLDPIKFQATKSVAIHEFSGPLNEALRIHVAQIEAGSGRAPLLLMATAPITGITNDVQEYSNHIIISFLLLGIGLLLAVVLQVRVALKPLQAISTQIGNVRIGKVTRLPSDYPEDVQPLVDELNNLLENNAVLLNRARNRLGDLAHCVKNPLTVIVNESRNMEPGQRELILQQTSEITRNVDHYLSRARAFGPGNVLGARTSIKNVVADLVYATQRIYQDWDLEYDLSGLNDCWFQGEAQDLEEMVGNLIDNACKWATSQVAIHCKTVDEKLLILVEDDGPGIPADKIDEVMQRGTKLDETKPGHGQGLGIVKDIAGLYGGSLKLATSKLGGLRAELELPVA